MSDTGHRARSVRSSEELLNRLCNSQDPSRRCDRFAGSVPHCFTELFDCFFFAKSFAPLITGFKGGGAAPECFRAKPLAKPDGLMDAFPYTFCCDTQDYCCG